MAKRNSSRNPDVGALNREFLSPNTLRSPSSLLSLKSVFLLDWWLFQAQGDGISVQGVTCREVGARLFRSAPILKRHDSITLETTDGITITLTGMINRSRALQSGFPVSVCNRFLLGFPYDWEDVSAERDASDNGGAPTLLPTSFDDLSAKNVRYLAMSIPKGSEGNFWDMIVKEREDEEVVKHVPNTKSSEAGNVDVSKGEDGKRDEVSLDTEVDGFVGGVMTRSMLRKTRKQQAENVIASEQGIMSKDQWNEEV
ncbi:Protein EMBRYO DEFECTIVE 1674 [Linum grandiflorum]